MKQNRNKDSILFKISGMKKLTITIVTGLVLCSVLLQPRSNFFTRHKSDFTTTRPNDSEKLREKPLGGLLTADFDEDSCLSRYHKPLLYRKASPYKPSEYLISKLRSYEMLHKNCGPGTEAYKRATEKLSHDDDNHVSTSSSDECRYILWVLPQSGLGNKILSLVSVFLYALLTERIILVDQRSDINDLFCEPFPGTSWLLPLDFPFMNQMDSFNREHSRCYGTILKNHAINSTATPWHLYLHLLHDYGDHDQMFFCVENQILINKVPWLFVKSNLYFVPSLWLIPSFQTELIKLFPQKATVFHHLSRYLFHPTNQVWSMITRTYIAYLSRADETLGIQIRVLEAGTSPLKHVMDQILACTQREQLLPQVNTQGPQLTTQRSSKLKSVLVTSLNPGYSENLKSMYFEYPSSTGEIVEVHQPSQEGYQQSGKKLHNQKALAEIYLLSMTDKVVISAWSTFGYVAQGLGGLKPWVLYKPENRTVPDPPCGRAVSMEPCFHAPPGYGCNGKIGINTGKIVTFVKHCEDRSWGIKLFEDPDEF